jgi:uncharacterized protein
VPQEGSQALRAQLNAITLGVKDLKKTLGFYRDALGLPTQGIVGTEFTGTEVEPAGAVAFFELKGGLTLALYPRGELAKDSRLVDTGASSLEFSLGHFVGSRHEVDDLLRRAEAAGATVTEEPHDRPWGIYSGYFKDLDGHLWEIIWNPQVRIDE